MQRNLIAAHTTSFAKKWALLAAILSFACGAQAINNPPSVGTTDTLSISKNATRSISYAELVSLTGAFDADGDPIQFVLSTVQNGVARVNGAPLEPGVTRIGKADVLSWVPPTDAYNVFVEAFQVKAFDGMAFSESATQIGVSISGNNPPELTFVEPFNRLNLQNAHRNESYTLRFDALKQASDARDMDGDAVSFAIDAVTAGTLSLDGHVVTTREIVSATNVLTWLPPTNIVGTVTAFKVVAFDGTDFSSTPIAVSIQVTDPSPTFIKGASPKVLRDDWGQWIPNWATAIRPDEYALHFETTTDKPELFSSAPEITDDGTLMFVTEPSAFGIATVTVVLADDQGHRSAPQSFTITIAFVNYAPEFEISEELNVSEDSGLQKVNEFARGISAGAGDEFQSLSFVVTVTNSALYSVKPAISTNGTLSFATATNAFGNDQVTVTLRDNGNTLNQGINATTKTFLLHVAPVNDAPTIALKTMTLNEDTAGTFDLGLKDNDSAVETLSAKVTSFTETLVSGAEVTHTGSAWTLHLTPRANAFGKGIIALAISDAETTVEYSIALNVTAVNDAPEFVLLKSFVAPQAFGQLTTISNVIGQVSAGANETNQSVTFELTPASLTFFATKPALTTNGTLKFKVADGVIGSNLVAIVAKDSGGVMNGGINQSAPQYFWIVSPKNPFPEWKGVYGGLFFEESGVKHASSGSLSATVTDKGSFSGKVQIEGGSYSFAGQFSTGGQSAVAINRPSKTALKLNLTLSGEGLSGTVSDGKWIAGLFADKSVYSLTNIAPQAGKYTLKLAGEETQAGGVATWTVSATGTVTGSANLSDGTLGTSVGFVTKRGQCPVYIPLYAGAGSILGWVDFTNAAVTDVEGSLSWIRVSTNALTGSGGFTNALTVSGSAYITPALGQRVLVTAPVSALFNDEKLPEGLTVRIALSTNNVITCYGNNLSLKANLQTGLVTGSFVHPITKTSTSIRGVVNQNLQTMTGFYATRDAVGSVDTR